LTRTSIHDKNLLSKILITLNILRLDCKFIGARYGGKMGLVMSISQHSESWRTFIRTIRIVALPFRVVSLRYRWFAAEAETA
jgi:hypothetical protein